VKTMKYLMIIGGGTIFSLAADAACPSGYTHSSSSCDDPYTSSKPICELDSTNKQIFCDLGSATTSAELTIVEDYDTTTDDFEAWGEIDGNAFCCVIPEPPPTCPCDIEAVIVFGSLQEDTINFAYNDGGTLRHLQPSLSSELTAWAFAGDDDDTIHGSGYGGTSGAEYTEYLCGMGAGDTINGHPGDDYIFGDCLTDHGFSVPSTTDSGQSDGRDTLFGDYGDDTMYGDADDDRMIGGPGDDYMQGDAGADTLEGQQGVDTIYGGDGPDGIDGGPQDDYLYGDDGSDAVCGGPGDDLVHGTNPLTSSDGDVDELWPGGETYDKIRTCDNTDGDRYQTSVLDVTGGCSTSISTKPSGCP
jgi:hypothetical protein